MEVFFGDRAERVGGRGVDVFQDRLQGGAVFHGHHHAAAVFDDLQHPLRAVHDGHAGQEHAGPAGQFRVRPAGPEQRQRQGVLFQVGGKARDAALEVQQFAAGHRRRVGLLARRPGRAAAALAIHHRNRRAELVVAHFHVPARLHEAAEIPQLGDPVLQRLGLLGLLRQLEHVHRARTAPSARTSSSCRRRWSRPRSGRPAPAAGCCAAGDSRRSI